MRFLFYPFWWVGAKINQWRLNKWLALRIKGATNDIALKKAWLSPQRTYKMLQASLNANVGSVGLLIFSRGKSSSVSSFEQTAILMRALAYLYPALPPEEQKPLLGQFQELTNHNWGYVRRAAMSALEILKRDTSVTIHPDSTK